jgi:hypothetical protein
MGGKIVEYNAAVPLEPQRIGKAIPITFVRTCRQIHAEATEILYSRNSFLLYTSNADFAIPYRTLLRHVTFTMEAGRGIYSDDLDVMCYWWRRVFWPNVVDKSTKMLLIYPNLQLLTLPIKSDSLTQTWRPAFFPSRQKTKQQRIALAAQWLSQNCPIRDERLRHVLRLEIQQTAAFYKMKQLLKESFWFPEQSEDDWDGSELAQAWIKSL